MDFFVCLYPTAHNERHAGRVFANMRDLNYALTEVVADDGPPVVGWLR